MGIPKQHRSLLVARLLGALQGRDAFRGVRRLQSQPVVGRQLQRLLRGGGGHTVAAPDLAVVDRKRNPGLLEQRVAAGCVVAKPVSLQPRPRLSDLPAVQEPVEDERLHRGDQVQMRRDAGEAQTQRESGGRTCRPRRDVDGARLGQRAGFDLLREFETGLDEAVAAQSRTGAGGHVATAPRRPRPPVVGHVRPRQQRARWHVLDPGAHRNHHGQVAAHVGRRRLGERQCM